MEALGLLLEEGLPRRHLIYLHCYEASWWVYSAWVSYFSNIILWLSTKTTQISDFEKLACIEYSFWEEQQGEFCASSQSITRKGQYTSSVALPGNAGPTSPACAYDCGGVRSCNESAAVLPTVHHKYVLLSVAQSRDLQKGAGESHGQ